MQRSRIEVARALAGNTRAILQVRSAGEIARALVMREALRESPQPDAGRGAEGAVGSLAPGLTLHEGRRLPDLPEQEAMRRSGLHDAAGGVTGHSTWCAMDCWR